MRSKYIIFAAFFSFVISIFIIGLVALSFPLIFKENENTSSLENSNIFQISSFNVRTNKSNNIGFVRISKKLPIINKENFLSFRSSDNKIFHTISKFSENEFECFGTCICEEEEEKYYERRNVNILSKSLYFIVSAVSLTLAINVASNFFKEECFENLRNECSENFISHNIEFCENREDGKAKEDGISTPTKKRIPKPSPPTPKKKKTTPKKQTKKVVKERGSHWDGIKEKKNKNEGKEYSCHGYCVRSVVDEDVRIMTRQVRKKKAVKTLKKMISASQDETMCEDNQITAELTLDVFSPTTIPAEIKFQKDILEPFCQKVSIATYVQEFHIFSRAFINRVTVFLCSAYRTPKERKGMLFSTGHARNVNCELVNF